MAPIRVSAAFLLGIPVLAGTVPEPRLELAFYNHAGVEAPVLAAAAGRVISVFERAGISVVWTSCPGPACPEILPRSFLVVSVVRRKAVARMIWPLGACGLAFPDGGFGFYALIDYDCVAIGGNPAQIGPLLGQTIAHEIGHLLLGRGSHSASGVMKERWGLAEKVRMERGDFLFLPREAVRMRSALRRRQDAALPDPPRSPSHSCNRTFDPASTNW